MKRTWMALLLVAACAQCAHSAPRYYQEEVSNTAYRLPEAGWRHTPGGVSIWDPKHEVNDALIDQIVDGVQACAAALAPTRAELETGRCPVSVPWLRRGFRRDLFSIAIAPDWYISSCTGKQLFPCSVSKTDCDRARIDKPEIAKCPGDCACRGTIQDNHLIVVTPNLELLPGRLFQLVTGCSSPWGFACAAPPKETQ